MKPTLLFGFRLFSITAGYFPGLPLIKNPPGLEFYFVISSASLSSEQILHPWMKVMKRNSSVLSFPSLSLHSFTLLFLTFTRKKNLYWKRRVVSLTRYIELGWRIRVEVYPGTPQCTYPGLCADCLPRLSGLDSHVSDTPESYSMRNVTNKVKPRRPT